MKKFIVALMCFCLALTSISFINVKAKETNDSNPSITEELGTNLETLYENTTPNTETLEEKFPLTDVDGTIYGTKIFKINKTTKKNEDSVSVKTNTTVYHEIDGTTTEIERYEDIFEYYTDGTIKVNNEIIPETDLQIGFNDTQNPIQPFLASGGRTFLTHYKETSKGKYKLTAYKEPTNWTLDGGKGTPRTKSGVKAGYLLTDFKNLARSVSSARDNIVIACSTIAAAGIPLIWSNIVTAIAAGGTIGVAALTIYMNSRSAKSDMKEAYNLL